MADSLVTKFHHSMLVSLIVVVVLSDRCTSGARCRFASTSASRGSCIFPCRCTNGCNTTTGECIKGGRCKDGLPSGYHWHGPACQIGEQRLDTFNLSVGYNSSINSQTVCARHSCDRKSCIVPKSGSLNTTCNAITRYLSFRRDGGYQPYSAGLCEVVVIGHRNISCKNESYGVNCLENCGQCKGNSACVATNGHCTNGCKDWYISDVCKTYIPVPHFRLPQKPQVDVITSSSAVKINDSGCDELVAVGVAYRTLTSPTDDWLYKEAVRVNQTQLSIEFLSYDVYEVNVTVTNNENISSTSETFTVSLTTTTSTTTTTTTTSIPTTTTAAGVTAAEVASDSGPGTGMIAGVSVAVIIVIAGVSAVIVVVVLRRRREEQQKTTDDIAVAFTKPTKQGSGKENVAFDDGKKAEEEDGNHNLDQAIYANTQQVTHGVTTGALAAYVEDKRRHNGFEKEFADLPSGIRAKCEAARVPDNKPKNRFVNIVAYDHTRVVLSAESGESDYINASHIMGYKEKKNAYIACQGPRDWTVEDVWRMVWQEKSNTVVMLANLVEMCKEKCSRYWPEKGKTQTWGSFIAESISEETVADYVIREFNLKNEKTRKMRRIRQFHFTSWPDKATPEYAYPLLAFHRKVHGFDSEKRGPLVVHCSAGVGRTGTFIAIDILIEQAKAEGKIDVFQCVNLLRTQRTNMVQTLDQYVYVYQALIESSDVTVIACSELRHAFNELCQDNKLSEQFERLNALKSLAKNVKCAALEPNNVEKNRFVDIIPDDRHRPYLVTPWKPGSNYINAVYVHGYKERNAYILTQSPMTATVVDMWRLLNDHESRTVVMLDDSDVTDDQCAVYWPTTKATKQQYGPFEVELVETVSNENSNVIERELKVNKSGRSEEKATVVKQFQLKNCWKEDELLPSNTAVLLHLLDMVEKWQQQSGNGHITIHCTDGASRCGLLCAASYVLEHMKVEQEVDVFHAVQHVRTTRPQLVTYLPQYRFLHELALAYMSQFDTYANFQ
ncbi:Receptor-type tyrosine-protein phosphatase mu [Lamellibrachia satsuma]|nr:Receptor-type tyrosine-protein phosphatase mu [Lamellibrachia satsuma]